MCINKLKLIHFSTLSPPSHFSRNIKQVRVSFYCLAGVLWQIIYTTHSEKISQKILSYSFSSVYILLSHPTPAIIPSFIWIMLNVSDDWQNVSRFSIVIKSSVAHQSLDLTTLRSIFHFFTLWTSTRGGQFHIFNSSLTREMIYFQGLSY